MGGEDSGPATHGSCDELRRAIREAAQRGGRQLTVLVVDDEVMMCEVLTRMLTMLGCRVLTAGDGQEGVSCFLEHRREIDLIMLDSAMPVMSGPECYRALLKIDPGVRVLVSTATVFSDEDIAQLYPGIAGFLQKPYGLAQLARAMAEATRRGA